MTKLRVCRIAAVTAALVLGVMALQAGAQETAVAASQQALAQQTQKGPLVFQQVQSGMVGAPEVRFTEISNHFGTLVGGYFGWLLDESFLIGGAAYWLVDGAYDRGIGYGGLELGWYAKLGSTARFGVRGLIGAGNGTAGRNVTYTAYPGWQHDHGGSQPGDNTGQVVTSRYVYTTGFFVTEPQASLVIKLADWVSIDANVGYRVIGAANGLRDQLQGPTGGIAVRFGAGR